jgi:hypothetical protein
MKRISREILQEILRMAFKERQFVWGALSGVLKSAAQEKYQREPLRRDTQESHSREFSEEPLRRDTQKRATQKVKGGP